MTAIIVFWPNNTYVQATPGVDSINFRTVDFGSAFFNWFYFVLRVLFYTLVLRCRMFILCVKEADLGIMAFVAYFASWLSEKYTMLFRTYHA